jgi:putative ABC transport system permease protein
VATVLGANTRQLRGLAVGEPLFVIVTGLICGAFTGWGLSYLLVKVLTGVFDPPPTALAFPWVYLVGTAACVVLAVGGASSVVAQRTRRNAREYLRDI